MNPLLGLFNGLLGFDVLFTAGGTTQSGRVLRVAPADDESIELHIDGARVYVPRDSIVCIITSAVDEDETVIEVARF